MTLNIQPVTLRGKFIQLEPLNRQHAAELSVAGAEAEIWKYMLYGEVTDLKRMEAWVEDIIGRAIGGKELPFAVLDLASGRIIGATRFLDIRAKDHGVEIGGTWYASDFRQTYVNPEAKYLLMRHAFEILGCVRVQFKTDSRNKRSIAALQKLGAKQEGVFRNHLILEEGVIRDSVFFSVIDKEWPEIKTDLERRLYK